MVTIRLSRGGSKRRPFYNIVVADSRSRRDGRFIERLGFYNPVAAGAAEELRLDVERVDHWVGRGAQITETTRQLVRRARRAAASAPALATPAAAAGPADAAAGSTRDGAASESAGDAEA